VPLTIDEVAAAYEAGAECTRTEAPGRRSRALWGGGPGPCQGRNRHRAAQGLGPPPVGRWTSGATARGRYLQFRPIGIDIERFGASARRPCPASGSHRAAGVDRPFALFSAGVHGPEGHVRGRGAGAPGSPPARRMVREAQPSGGWPSTRTRTDRPAGRWRRAWARCLQEGTGGRVSASLQRLVVGGTLPRVPVSRPPRPACRPRRHWKSQARSRPRLLA